MVSLGGNFKERFRALLALSGMTQAELARKANVPAPQVSRWLNGDRVPRRANILKIAEGLGVRPDELLGPHREPAAHSRTQVERPYRYMICPRCEQHGVLDEDLTLHLTTDCPGRVANFGDAEQLAKSAEVDPMPWTRTIERLRIEADRYQALSDSRKGARADSWRVAASVLVNSARKIEERGHREFVITDPEIEDPYL